MTQIYKTVALGIAAFMSTFPCHAQPTNSDSSWEFNAGPTVLSVPKYPGSKERLNILIPFIEARGPNGIFINLDRGIGQELALREGMRLSYSLAVDLNYRRKQDDVLFSALDEIKPAPAVRIELAQDIGQLTLATSLMTRLGASRQGGTLLSSEATYQLTQDRNFLVSVGLNAKFMDHRFAQNFFSVTPAQAAASAVTAYSAKAGFYGAAPFLQSLLTLNENWTAFGRIEFGRLRGDASGSPLVREQNGSTLVLSLSRSF